MGSLLLTTSSGMLNALTSIYSGAVLKTATVTSTATDIGVEIGNVFFVRCLQCGEDVGHERQYTFPKPGGVALIAFSNRVHGLGQTARGYTVSLKAPLRGSGRK